MASPLATIRKYDKILLAVFGVLLMFAFLVGDPLSMMVGSGGGGGGGGRPTSAVSFKGGSLSDLQLAVMHRADNLADELLRKIYTETLKAKATPRDFPEVPLRPVTKTERGLVYQELLARKAHDLGLSLSDSDIDRLLRQLSDETLDDADLKKLRREVLEESRGSNIQITDRDLYSQLRTKLLAQQMQALLRSEVSSPAQMFPTMVMPPTEAWDYYRRTARQVKAEVMPLPVDKFLDEVEGQPTAKEKEEIFEKYKNKVPTPLSPEPGLAEPQRVAFGYVRLDLQKYIDEAKANITEEELQAEYEKRRENGEFKVPVLPDDKKGEQGDEKPEDEKKSVDDVKPDDAKPEDAKPEESKSDDAQPAEDKQEESKPADEGSDDELEEEDSSQPAATEPKTDEAAVKPEDKADAAGEEKPAEKPVPAESTESTEADSSKDGEAAKSGDAKKKEPKKQEMRVRTFDEVRDEILSSLAQKPANDKRQEAFKALAEKVEEFQVKHAEWAALKETADQEKNKKKKEPVPDEPELAPELRDVLKKYDLEYKQLDLMDQFEILGDELGESSIFVPGQYEEIAFPRIGFDPGLKPFQPLQSYGLLRNVNYIFWKEKEQPSKAAELKGSEEKIVQVWKRQKAYNLALKEAQDLAEKAKGHDSLREAFPEGVEKAGAIQETDPFSWLTAGHMPMGMTPLRVTQIPQVPYAGDEFMQTVMDLKPGEVGAAPDQSHKTVYVVRVISQTPSEEVLRSLFLARGVMDPNIAMQYASDRRQQFESWFENLEKEMQVTWNRDPHNFER